MFLSSADIERLIEGHAKLPQERSRPLPLYIAEAINDTLALREELKEIESQRIAEERRHEAAIRDLAERRRKLLSNCRHVRIVREVQNSDAQGHYRCRDCDQRLD